MIIKINYILAAALAICTYYLGTYLKNRIKFLRDYYLPEPVIGGFVFALFHLLLYKVMHIRLHIDNTLQYFFMAMFFTSIGFATKAKTVKAGGQKFIILGVLCAILIFTQNAIAIAVAKAMGFPALLGLCCGSMPMIGGHGSASFFGRVIEGYGVHGAFTSALAMATLGLVMGGIIGGPLAGFIVNKHKLHGIHQPYCEESKAERCFHFTTTPDHMMRGLAMLLLAMGFGSIIWEAGKLFHFEIPIYAGGICLAILMTNLQPENPNAALHVPAQEINILAGLALNMFLSMALIDLKLWQLSAVAGALSIIAILQILFICFFSYFIVFRILGSDYDAAVTVAALCGFGLGALPTGMANMNSITSRFGAAPLVYLAIPIISSIADCINGSTIILLLNLLK